MPKETVLIVEDEKDILELLSYTLSREGYRVATAMSGEAALDAVRQTPPDIVLLDLMLPGMDGLQVTRRLKADSRTRPIPIIMLTARGEEIDIVAGLETGADDYVTKPFSPRVLLARIRAVARRRETPDADPESPLQVGSLSIHTGRRTVTVGGDPVDLTYSEFQILVFLARRPGWVFTRSQIVDAVHGNDYPVTERSVDVQIVGLRKKLGPYGAAIETVRGVGYRFKEDR